MTSKSGNYSQLNNIAESLTVISRSINQIAKRVNGTNAIYAADINQLRRQMNEVMKKTV